MAEKENRDDPEVNLEMPSLGFGGRRKRRRERAPGQEAPTGRGSSAEADQLDEPATWAAPAEETRPLYVDDVPPAVPATEDPALEPPDVSAPDSAPGRPAKKPKAAKPARASKPPKPAKPARADRPPIITGMTAALVTGLVVGLLTVGLTALGTQACEAVRDSESCGGAGFFMWVAILVGMVVLGSSMLKLFRVVDPGSTSFLAVGLAIVIVLLFLIDYVFEWWMAIVAPVVFVLTYALAHWVTVRFIEPADQ